MKTWRLRTMAKISFGTVEELFSELKEKNQTEDRIEP
jgi:hypothetical protein